MQHQCHLQMHSVYTICTIHATYCSELFGSEFKSLLSYDRNCPHEQGATIFGARWLENPRGYSSKQNVFRTAELVIEITQVRESGAQTLI